MEKRILIKVLISAIIIMTLILYFTPATLAIVNAKDWEPNGAMGGAIINKGNTILGLIQVVGIIVSVITLMIIGIKYVVGSAEERAEYKKTMLPYLIGAVMLFGASAIVNMIYEWSRAL